jgi:hypothetical protein
MIVQSMDKKIPTQSFVLYFYNFIFLLTHIDLKIRSEKSPLFCLIKSQKEFVLQVMK